MLLSTGKKFRIGGAGNEILGISADLNVTEGYDEDNEQWSPPVDEDSGEVLVEQPLTDEEKVEVCEKMIERWEALRERLRQGLDVPRE